MSKQYSWQFGGQDFTSEQSWWHSWVNRVRIEICLLLVFGFFHTQLHLNVFLSSVLNSDETKSQIDFLVHDHSFSISTSVHNIDLGNDTNSPDSFRVKSSGCSDTFWSSHIGISWNHTKNDCSWVCTVPLDHSSCDLLDVLSLASNWDESDTWQIN